MSLKRLITFATLVLCLVLLTTTTIFAQPIDIAGHWAEAELTAWVNQGLLGGYADGTVKPDNNITRAEFFAFMNRAFKLSPTDVVEIKDVSESDWYYIDVLTAINHGYVGGYPDGSILPNNLISREEVASVLSRFLNLAPTEDLSALQQFTDAPSDWSKAAVDAVVAAKLMGGYPDGTFRATNPITRAEAIVTINRAMNLPAPEPELVLPNLIGEAGTYGPETGTLTFTGDITINAADVILRNVIITGNLTLGEGIGDGNVTLQNVTVQGETIVNGGGAHSIYLENFTAGDVTVNKPGVRLVATGNTRVSNVIITDSAIIAEVDLDGDGFVDAQISEQLPEGATVELAGNFGTVTVSSAATVNLNGSAATVNVNAGAAVTLGGSVTNLNVAATAAGANVTVNSNASVGTLTANAAVTVSGDGAITTAVINANGVTIAQTPTTTTVAPGITANVGGKEITGTTTPTTGGGGGGDGGGGGVTPTPNPPKITGFSNFAIAADTKTMTYTGGGRLTSVAVTIDSPGVSNTLTMKIGSTEIYSWNIPNGTSQIAMVRDILGSAGRMVDFYLASGLSEADFAKAVDFTGMIRGVTSQTDKAKVYNAIIPLITNKLANLSAEAYSEIYSKLDLPRIVAKADDATKNQIKAALSEAIAFYNTKVDPDITFSDLVNNQQAIIDTLNAADWKDTFYTKVNVSGILDAVKGKLDLINELDEVALFNAVAKHINVSDLALAIYGQIADFEESTKSAIYGSIDFGQLISSIRSKGKSIAFTITDNVNNQSATYTLN